MTRANAKATVPAQGQPTEEPLSVMVVGPYGGVNLGDDYILHGIGSLLLTEGVSICVSSLNPAATERDHDFPAVQAYEPRRGRFRALQGIANFDAVLIGGGEQIQEARSRSPFWGHLPQVAAQARLAQARGVPTFVWAVGVDAGISPWGRSLLRWGFRRSFFSVRDRASMERVGEYGLVAERLELAADPVFLTPPEDRDVSRHSLLTDAGLSREVVRDSPLILFILCRDQKSSLAYLQPLLRALEMVREESGAVLIGLWMENRKGGDRELARDKRVRSLGASWISPSRFDPVALRRYFAGADVVVSCRMHPLILATTQGTPWLGIARSAKMTSLFQELGVPFWIDIDSVQSAPVAARLEYLLGVGGPEFLSALEPGRRELEARASRPLRWFREWLSCRRSKVHGSR